MLPIRRLLLRDLLALMAGVVALILGISWLNEQAGLSRQAEARAQTALEHLNQRLLQQLKDSQSLGNLVEVYWRNGSLDPARPDEAARLLLPLLLTHPAITSLNLARADGPSLLFLRQEGEWSMRELLEPGPSARIRWHRLGRAPRVEPWRGMAYDPRVRPWYSQAAQAGGPTWTPPYTFYTTKDPGITYTLPIRDSHGLQGVAALDFLLDDLTTVVWATQPTSRSRCLILDGNGRALVLPNDPAFHLSEARRSAFLKTIGPGFLQPQWKLLSEANGPGKAFGSRVQGESILGLVKEFNELPGIQWQLLLSVPVADLLGPAWGRISSLLILGVISLGLSIWRILVIARRVAGPITLLGSAAEALGQGQQPPRVRSRISEIRSLDRALQQASGSLSEQSRLQRQLEHSQRMESVGTLAGGIAHDVNNQLAVILGQLHLCREGLSEEHSALMRIQRAEDALHRCAQTTKALLSFSHKSRPELRALDLNTLVQETATILEHLLGGRIRLVLALAPDLPLIHGDGVQLEQVIINLSVNARDAMPEGGLLSLTTRLCEDGRVIFEVQDSGPGFSEAILPRLFEPFFTTKAPGKGTGLGLAMVYAIVKAHHGQIQAANSPDGGALFRITLPPSPAEAASTSAPPPKRRSNHPRLMGKRVLIVEDEPLLRELLSEALTLAHMHATAAQDGAVAWKIWQQQNGFDIVISDQRMPECTGMELLQQIRATGSEVPFILASGQGLEDAETTLDQDPHLRLLPKPFNISSLLPTMENLITTDP